MEKFLTEQNLPSHLQHLLKLAGVSCIEDLEDVNEEFVEDFEKKIRGGDISGLVDFGSRSNRIKYFGLDIADLEQFRFRMLDKKKLLKLSVAAELKRSMDDEEKQRQNEN